MIKLIPNVITEHIDSKCPSMPQWGAICTDPTPPCFTQVMKDLLKLYVYTTVCDPPMSFDPDAVGQEIKFDPEFAAPLDDKIKLGKACFVLCPPLKGADGMVKAKAMVLAADYL